MEDPEHLEPERLRFSYIARRISPLHTPDFPLAETVRSWEVPSSKLSLRSTDVCGIDDQFWYGYEILVISSDGRARYLQTRTPDYTKTFRIKFPPEPGQAPIQVLEGNKRTGDFYFDLEVGQFLYTSVTHRPLRDDEVKAQKLDPQSFELTVFTAFDRVREATGSFVGVNRRQLYLGSAEINFGEQE